MSWAGWSTSSGVKPVSQELGPGGSVRVGVRVIPRAGSGLGLNFPTRTLASQDVVGELGGMVNFERTLGGADPIEEEAQELVMAFRMGVRVI